MVFYGDGENTGQLYPAQIINQKILNERISIQTKRNTVSNAPITVEAKTKTARSLFFKTAIRPNTQDVTPKKNPDNIEMDIPGLANRSRKIVSPAATSEYLPEKKPIPKKNSANMAPIRSTDTIPDLVLGRILIQ
jgi:hypothetical protein